MSESEDAKQLRDKMTELIEAWRALAKTYRQRAIEWQEDDALRARRLADAVSLEKCAYALEIAMGKDE
jgi:hypothetical protein